MGKVTKVDTARLSIAISRDLRMCLVEHQPGPPALCDGLIVAIADMTRTPPHGGELHPDGDELIYIISGKVKVIGETAPDEPCELGPGEACIVSKGEWHLVQILEPRPSWSALLRVQEAVIDRSIRASALNAHRGDGTLDGVLHASEFPPGIWRTVRGSVSVL